MAEPFVDRLTPLLETGDVVGGRLMLDSLTGQELAEAKQWFAGSRRFVRDLHELDFAGADQEERSRARWEASWIIAMCAVRLCGPTTAARRVPWRDLWDFMRCDGEAQFVHLLWETDRAWVGQFAETASGVGLGGQARNVNATLSRVVRAAVIHHGLPCPSGATFLAAWSAGTGAPTYDVAAVRDWPARDPLMPDLLHHYLASGHCGQVPGLPDAVPELVAAGVLDREALLEHVLGLMTAPQRPASQRVLAGVFTALNPRPDEITGGLTYLLGVISTAHGSVGQVLLPMALELVDDPDGLLELTTVVAGRPERRQKSMLLKALVGPSLRARVGDSAVREALRVLATDDDAAFISKVTEALTALGDDGTDSESDSEAPVLGLWGLEPATHLEVDAFRTRWRKQLPLGQVPLSTLIGELNDLFLAGGLRPVWPVALELADTACRMPRKPAGLADLLRLLATYAVEVPRPRELPPYVAALAAQSGRSKAQMEARRLGSLLAAVDVDDYVAGLRQAGAQDVPPRVRGLWQRGAPINVLPSTLRVDDPVLDVPALRRQLEATSSWHGMQDNDLVVVRPDYVQRMERVNLTFADRLLAVAVRAIHEHGVADSRRLLQGIERPGNPFPVPGAIDLWASGHLEATTFWRLARRSMTALEHHRRLRDNQWFNHAGQATVVDAVTAAGDETIVLPVWLNEATTRLTFLLACEALAKVEQTSVLLSTPTYREGTLDFDDLFGRLRAVAAGGVSVGPLDLVQALHRLRPTDPARAVELAPLEVMTDAAFTSPDGDEAWDAVELVRTWLARGGLPSLDPVVEDGEWSTAAVAPVPWSRCAALPEELRADPWCPGPMVDAVRMMPLWGDRCAALDHPEWEGYGAFPTLIAGPLGLPMHDRFLQLMTRTGQGGVDVVVSTMLSVLRLDRLDPQLAAAAALRRHAVGTLDLAAVNWSAWAAFEFGGFRGLWPSLLKIAAALCTVPEPPAELPALMGLLSDYAHEVPEPVIPESLRVFADGAGAARGRTEARALVEGLSVTAADTQDETDERVSA
jgi:hypothetical protein